VIDFEPVFYSTTAAQTGLQKASGRTAMTALEHNSMVVAFALLMDRLANPQVTNVTVGGRPYWLENYSGPLADKETPAPVYGGLQSPGDPPTGATTDAAVIASAALWWAAVAQFLRRLGQGLQVAPSDKSATLPGGQLVLLAGIPAEAAVPATTTGAITEDMQTSAVAGDLYAAAYAAADRIQRAATGGGTTAVSAAEQAAARIVTTLRDEYAAETKRAGMMALGIGAGVVGASALIGRMA
jgi:hypothetical protein